MINERTSINDSEEKRKPFDTPIIEIILLTADDVITTSGEEYDDDEGNKGIALPKDAF